MPGPLAPLGALVRLVGVLALLGLVAMHVAVAPAAAAHDGMGTGHAGTSTAAPTSAGVVVPTSARAVVLPAPLSGGAVTDDGVGCPMTHHGQSVSAMDCASAAAPSGPGSVSLAAPPLSHLLPPAALPRWPSPWSAVLAPPVAAPTHVILRT